MTRRAQGAGMALLDGTQATVARVAVAFIGSAAPAAGYRLAGARTWSPQPGDETAALAAAMAQADLVVLSAELARRLPESLLEEATLRLSPLVLIEPDGGAPSPALDPVSRARRQLSLEVGAEPPRTMPAPTSSG